MSAKAKAYIACFLLAYAGGYVLARRAHVLVYSEVNTPGVKCAFTWNARILVADMISPYASVAFFPLHRVETLIRAGFLPACDVSFRHSVS